MGRLGQYLRSAREARGIDLRDAAQQTRISVNYLKALEEEDFAKLPGQVFVKGFLKNYARFLGLDDAETLQRYGELKPETPPPAALQAPAPEPARVDPTEDVPARKTAWEPYVWGSVICVALVIFLFNSFPGRRAHKEQPSVPNQTMPGALPVVSEPSSSLPGITGRLYLEVDALEDTWLLVRTDTSPQKKAVLKKGESLIWSADERFLLSYGRASALKLLLNGEELTVRAAADTPIRDLAIMRTGILNQPGPVKPVQVVKKPKTVPVQTGQTLTNSEHQVKPVQAVKKPKPMEVQTGQTLTNSGQPQAKPVQAVKKQKPVQVQTGQTLTNSGQPQAKPVPVRREKAPVPDAQNQAAPAAAAPAPAASSGAADAPAPAQ